MNIGMRRPGIHQNSAFIREVRYSLADKKLRVSTIDFQKDMAVGMSVPHKIAIHIQKCDTAKTTRTYSQGF